MPLFWDVLPPNQFAYDRQIGVDNNHFRPSSINRVAGKRFRKFPQPLKYWYLADIQLNSRPYGAIEATQYRWSLVRIYNRPLAATTVERMGSSAGSAMEIVFSSWPLVAS